MAELLSRWRRPSPAIIVAFICALATLIALGIWQLDRRAWKMEILDRVSTRMAAEPLPLPAVIPDPEALEYRHVIVRGTYLHDREMFLSGRYYRGQLGLQVITPLVRANGAGIVLVNRGWIPAGKKDPATRPESLVQGERTVTGLIRLPVEPGLFVPDNDPATGFWMTPDVPAMADAAGLADVEPLILYADRGANPQALPVGSVLRVDFRNDHLQYALTWFSLALVLIVIFAAFHYRRPEKE